MAKKQAVKDVMELTIDQFRSMSSPVRADIIAAFMGAGPSSVAEIAKLTGRRATAVHYHVGELLRVNLLMPDGTRQAGKRYETIYRATARRFKTQEDTSPEYTEEDARSARILLRNAAKNYERALKSQSGVPQPYLETLNVRLNEDGIAKLMTSLEALVQETRKNQDPEGTRITLLSVLVPYPFGRASETTKSSKRDER